MKTHTLASKIINKTNECLPQITSVGTSFCEWRVVESNRNNNKRQLPHLIVTHGYVGSVFAVSRHASYYSDARSVGVGPGDASPYPLNPYGSICSLWTGQQGSSISISVIIATPKRCSLMK
ncbi:unnamed protein product [Pieris macdunnoughi]|uniref:Uncharacterized protein n=1 Tax=Pieris macdunnoughi TaxID=345717 RepID=A0A821MMP3_9NEOP|nr:unnamed protein product [Pieris macdunnoughi]